MAKARATGAKLARLRALRRDLPAPEHDAATNDVHRIASGRPVLA